MSGTQTCIHRTQKWTVPQAGDRGDAHAERRVVQTPTLLSGFLDGLLVRLERALIEANDGDTLQLVVRLEFGSYFAHGNSGGPIDGESVRTGADGWEGNAPDR